MEMIPGEMKDMLYMTTECIDRVYDTLKQRMFGSCRDQGIHQRAGPHGRRGRRGRMVGDRLEGNLEDVDVAAIGGG